MRIFTKYDTKLSIFFNRHAIWTLPLGWACLSVFVVVVVVVVVVSVDPKQR